MKFITVVDAENGLLFGGKRLSRDRILLENINEEVQSGTLYCLPFSEKLMGQHHIECVVSASFPGAAGDGDVWFTEDTAEPNLASFDTVVLYNWNRLYPSDVKLNIDLSAFKQCAYTEFQGSSHEKIGKTVFVRDLSHQ